MDETKQNYKDFSELFDSLMYQLGIHANRRVVDLLEKEGIVLAQRTLQRYRTGERVPNLITARKLLKVLDSEMDDEELIILLKKEKKDIRKSTQIIRALGFDEHSEDRGLKVFNVKIDTTQLNINADESISKADILVSRVTELYENIDSLELYIRKLIEDDINGLITSEEENDDK